MAELHWVFEEKILSQEAACDRQTFLSYYDSYFPKIYTYFRYRCGDAQLCDDLTAQTFEQALTHLHQFDAQRGSFAAWLFGIARNLANAHLREQLRWKWMPLEHISQEPSSYPEPEDQVLNQLDRELLLKTLQTLEPRQRDLLALKFSGGLNNRQIAALTGLSEQNVAVILFRTVRQLRKGIADHD